MATTFTSKHVILRNEDKYRKEKMINWLKSRGMLSAEAERFIKKGQRV